MNIVHLPEPSKALFHRRTGRISNEIIETTKSWSLCHPSAGGPADCRSPARGPADRTSALAGTDTRPCSPRPGPGCQPRSTQPVPCSELLPPSCSAPVAYPFYPSSWFTSKIFNEDMLEKYKQQNNKTMRKKTELFAVFWTGFILYLSGSRRTLNQHRIQYGSYESWLFFNPSEKKLLLQNHL